MTWLFLLSTSIVLLLSPGSESLSRFSGERWAKNGSAEGKLQVLCCADRKKVDEQNDNETLLRFFGVKI